MNSVLELNQHHSSHLHQPHLLPPPPLLIRVLLPNVIPTQEDVISQTLAEASKLYTVKKKACNAHQIWCATFVPSGTPYMA